MDPSSLSGETKQPYLEKPRLVAIQDTKIEDFSFPIFVEIVPMFIMEDDDTSAEAVIESFQLPSDEAIQKIEGHPKNTSELASTYNTHEILKNQEDLASLLQDDDWDLEYVDSENLPHQPSQDTLVILTSEKEKASSRDDIAPDPGEYVDSLEESSIQGPPTTSSVTEKAAAFELQPVLDTPDFDVPGLINALDNLPADIVMELWNEVLMETNLNIQATSNVIIQGPENVDDPSKRLQLYTDLDRSVHPDKDQVPLDSPASLFTRELEPEGQASNSHDIQSGAPEVATETYIRSIEESIISVDIPDSNINEIHNSPFLSLESPAPREGSEFPIGVLDDTELTATNPNEEPQSMVSSDDLWPVTNSDEIQHSLDISTRTCSHELEYLTIDQKEGMLQTANLNDARSAPVPLSRVTDASQSSAPLEDLDTSMGTPIRPRNLKRKRLILEAVEISLLSPAMKKMYRKPSMNGSPHDAKSFRSKQADKRTSRRKKSPYLFHSRLQASKAAEFPIHLAKSILNASFSRKFFGHHYGGVPRVTFPKISAAKFAMHGLDDFMYLFPLHTPHAPKVPGAPGIWWTIAQGEDIARAQPRPKIQRVISKLESGDWQYQGQYVLLPTNSLTKEEWRSLDTKVRSNWAREIQVQGWGRPTRVRIALRSHLGRLPTRAHLDAVLKTDDKFTEVTVKQITDALWDGKESLAVWILKCVDYDVKFQLDLIEKHETWTTQTESVKVAERK